LRLFPPRPQPRRSALPRPRGPPAPGRWSRRFPTADRIRGSEGPCIVRLGGTVTAGKITEVDFRPLTASSRVHVLTEHPRARMLGLHGVETLYADGRGGHYRRRNRGLQHRLPP